MAENNINSDAYWNTRFGENWESYAGPLQSRFFAKIAIEYLPNWLIEQLKRQFLTLADWGCAQGDGTDVWASYVDAQQIVGIDFSSVAIKQASQRYPAIRFANEDWLTMSSDEGEIYDVVFSSNTLEHFHRPYEVLRTIGNRAKKAIVLALPYQEMDRIDEHFFSFLPGNIPLKLTNGFRLIWSRVVDCRTLPNTLWNGDQVILVYAAPNWLDDLELTLNDCNISQIDTTSEIKYQSNELAILSKKNLELGSEIAKKELELAVFSDVINKRNVEIADYRDKSTHLNDELLQKSTEINSLHIIKETKNREMMRLSDWAHNISEHPLRYGFKKHLRAIAKNLYCLLPVSTSVKLQIKSIISHGQHWAQEINKQPVQENENRNEKNSSFQITLKQSNSAANAMSSKLCSLLERSEVINSRDLFFFSVIDWHFRIQRPQQLACSFAKTGKRVFYFSNHFVDSTTPGYEIERLDPHLELYQIKLHVRGAPAIYFASATAEAITMLEQGIAKLIFDFSAVSSVSLVEHGYWHQLVKRLPNTLKVYDCMDYHEGFGNVSEELIKIEKAMLTESDLVVVTSGMLEEIACKYNENVVMIRNAGEYEHFSEAPKKIFTDPQGRKIIGYFGAIAEWFDLEIIRAIAISQPDTLILLVGNDTIFASKTLKDLHNVKFTGEVPYGQLPYYLYAFDVCLLPFKVIPLTLATNPVKVYEYLAAGKPVVCVDLPEIAQFGNLLHCAKTINEFNYLVNQCISKSDSTELCDKRRQFAAEQTWNHRANTLSLAIQAISLPKISVIVLTYNNLDLTKSCLDSLISWSMYPNIEIIVVDNASIDATPLYLKEFQILHPQVKIILNENNLGFAAGNNAGLLMATGEYLVMLNNDTVVTPGWLLTMLRHLQADPEIGIIGPVTNNIGNEAKIDIKYNNTTDMLPLAVIHTVSHMGRSIQIQTAAFFCVMMSRKVFEQVGLLDENFGRGFFEDDDYCRRVEQLGLRIVCAEDVFVHHHLSASFNKLGDDEKRTLFEKNKTYYESKWGKWFPHEYRN